MVTVRIVTPDSKVLPFSVAGYESLEDAERALSGTWPITKLIAYNVRVLADYDDCRLILQRGLVC